MSKTFASTTPDLALPSQKTSCRPSPTRRRLNASKGPRGEKRPADVIGNTVKVMRIATGEESEEIEIANAAATLGKLGGKARAKKLTPEQRAEISRLAATSSMEFFYSMSGPKVPWQLHMIFLWTDRITMIQVKRKLNSIVHHLLSAHNGRFSEVFCGSRRVVENAEPVLLIAGLGVQLIGWTAPFCEMLAAQGFL